MKKRTKILLVAGAVGLYFFMKKRNEQAATAALAAQVAPTAAGDYVYLGGY